jgi:glucose/arabinose dehydrogenase
MRRVVLILAASLAVAAVIIAASLLSRTPSDSSEAEPHPASTTATTTPGTTPLAASSAAGSTAGVAASTASATPPAVALQEIAGTFDHPVYVTSPPGDTSRLFVVEQGGLIRIVKNGGLLGTPFLDLTGAVSSGGERGLLSLAFDPKYAQNRRFYVDYTNTAGNTRVVRYQTSATNPDLADPSSGKVLLAVHQPYSNHNGGQLQFGPDGRLYVGMGDGGSGGDPQNRAQNSHSRLGKILRIKLGNPPRVGVYAKGLRNPWRFSFDRSTGALWIGDVGQNNWEEIDYLAAGRKAGANLGWSAYEGTHVYKPQAAAKLTKSKLVWPVSQYSHSVGEAVTGGYVYRGMAIPRLRGFYLFADYGSGRVWAKKGRRGSRVRLPGADGAAGMISSFGQDASGELYIVSYSRGAVYKIVPRP